MFCFKLYLSKNVFLFDLIKEKTAKKGITVLPKSAAKPDKSIFYGTFLASVPVAVVHNSSKLKLPRGHCSHNMIAYSRLKVKVFYEKCLFCLYIEHFS